MRIRSRRRLVWGSVCLLAVATLVACSSDSGTSDNSPGAHSPDAETSASGISSSPVPSFVQPYPYGMQQAKVPPITNGKAPVIRKIATDKPFVFITIDDGAVQAKEALQLMAESDVRPTLFLNEKYVKGNEDYFKNLQTQAHVTIENHTVDHPNLKKLSYADQYKQICGDSDAFAQVFGSRPTLFRPPFGTYNDDTLRAVAACGMKAVVLWSAAVNNGIVQFQSGKKLQQGDIVLMHFRKTFVKDFTAFLVRAKQDGLTPVPLTDFLG